MRRTGLLFNMLMVIMLTTFYTENVRAWDDLKYKIQGELDQNPFLQKENIKLHVVSVQNGYVTIEMIEGQQALREAIYKGFDIFSDSSVLLLLKAARALGGKIKESGLDLLGVHDAYNEPELCSDCSLSSIKALKKSINYIYKMKGVKEVLLTAAVNTPLDQAKILFEFANEYDEDDQYKKAASLYKKACKAGEM